MIAVLWSHTQQAFHIEEINEYVKQNLRNYLANTPADFTLLGVAPNHTEANILIAKLQKAKETP